MFTFSILFVAFLFYRHGAEASGFRLYGFWGLGFRVEGRVSESWRCLYESESEAEQNGAKEGLGIRV